MIQFLLMLLGFIFPDNNVNTSTISQDPTIIQSTDIGEGSDTGGETIPLPPKK